MTISDLATGQYLEVNDSFCLVSGYGRAEALGRTSVQLGWIDAAERQRMASELMKHGKVSGLELALRRKDGSPLVCRYWGDVVHSAKGDLLFSAAEDISERKRLRAGLAQNDRLASMGMLAAGIAHEINNPLAYVFASVDTLAEVLPGLARILKECRPSLPDRPDLPTPEALDDLVESAENALDGARRIRKIARGLGSFARVERVELNTIDVNGAVETAVTMAHNEVKYRATLVKDLGRVPAVRASEGTLEQVFLNLIINAAHAIGEGHVDRNRITLTTWTEGGDVLVGVADTGPGIPAENLGRIFEPFFTTKKVGEGSGLGLAIAKNIVTEFGGDLRVDSEVGRGSRFVVRLPAVHPRPRPCAGGCWWSTTRRCSGGS